MPRLSIGHVAKATDVKVTTIRFYEQIGLLPVAARTESAHRLYDNATIKRLTFIRQARQFGFSVEAIRVLLDLSDNPDRACHDATKLAREQLDAVEAKIEQLILLRRELQQMVSTGCAGFASGCGIIESLGRSEVSEPSFVR